MAEEITEQKYRSIGIGKLGMPWWVECNEPFELIKYPNCGFPMYVKVTNPNPIPIEEIRFTFDEGERTINLNEVKELLQETSQCNLCGYKEVKV